MKNEISSCIRAAKERLVQKKLWVEMSWEQSCYKERLLSCCLILLQNL